MLINALVLFMVLSGLNQYIKTRCIKTFSNWTGGYILQLDMTTWSRRFSYFGDGAGAAVLSREEDLTKGILSTHLHSKGNMLKN
jgi:3-oxoacyl-[acyl-carrier-protein] synthase-3